MTALVLTVFALVYLGMALGRLPGLQVDRTGIALLGAIALLLAGVMDDRALVAAVDFPTLFILLGLMVLSAQFELAGFYGWCADRVARARRSPEALLGLVVLTGGALSAVLANDVVVFAMTPLLCAGLAARGLDPRPYLIALAGAANAGSAATLIGNPQNILIGQVGGLGFWPFLAACGVPALLALGCVYVTVARVWRGRLVCPGGAGAPVAVPELDRWQLGKGALGTLALLALFATPLPHEQGVLAVAACMLVSRKLGSRRMLGLVDWHLLLLFASLFVVTRALADTGLPGQVVGDMAAAGLPLERLAVLAPLSLLASNSIGNVPAVALLMQVWPDPSDGALYALAVLSTLAGNLLLTGSMANLIVAERAAAVGVRLSFAEHARCGIPMTLSSTVLASLWLVGMGYVGV
ncbi:anion transporter [Aerophototrophica crusticola]|uniref:Anion transporter n=1 Tax=Aerophototrophica crusticola TaxID=1709002 RepID=A0A858R7W7_9PROT|nr:anion transporter [Rhodospirillaceae bacterium B3]